MQLEEKQVAATDSSEIVLVFRAPEIDLFGPALGKKPEPIVVRDADVKLHGEASPVFRDPCIPMCKFSLSGADFMSLNSAGITNLVG